MSGRMTHIRWVAAAALVTVLLGMAPAMASAQTASQTVVVEQIDFGLKPVSNTVAPGDVTFAVKNTGIRPHELVVIKSNLDPRALPLKDGRVDEAAVEIVSRLPRIQPPGATTGILNANLTAGRYVVICNIGTHYAQGMSFSLGVGTAALPTTPAPAQQVAPAPARTGTGGPLGAASAAGPIAQIALGLLALGLVAGARIWTSATSSSRRAER